MQVVKGGWKRKKRGGTFKVGGKRGGAFFCLIGYKNPTPLGVEAYYKLTTTGKAVFTTMALLVVQNRQLVTQTQV